ncbi:insect allergen related repeat, nitrile-specifier detoxification domain-containing protein [Phthorimaea operculella]|nr:insect allergen related repeat, nitrile-specifier detoxification domain-containing protein [Phthorimaea operculella]
MLKLLSFNVLVLLCGASVIQVPLHLKTELEIEPLQTLPSNDLEEIQEKWSPHIMEFLNMVDVDKLMKVIMEYVSDPDVTNFINFISSKDFQEVAIKFEDIEEFKEAMAYLQNKGYDVKSILDLINSLLSIQSSKRHELMSSEKDGKGMTRFIKDMLQVLPVDDWKILFEKKLETSADVRELFEALSAKEFQDILKRLAANPELTEIKKVFEFYGFDFDEISIMVDEVFGDRFEKIVYS